MKRPRRPLPSQGYLKAIFDYDQESGNLRHLTSRGCVAAGAVAGSLADNGFMIIRIDRRSYYLHRIIWCWMTGEDLGDVALHHKDGNLANNAFDNLVLRR